MKAECILSLNAHCQLLSPSGKNKKTGKILNGVLPFEVRDGQSRRQRVSDRSRKGEMNMQQFLAMTECIKHTNTYMTCETFTNLFQLFP